MSRADNSTMDQFHALTVQVTMNQLQAYLDGTMRDADGNVLPCPPSLLQAAAKLLKDNGIDRPDTPTQATDKLKGLLPQLDAPDLSEFGNVSRIR